VRGTGWTPLFIAAWAGNAAAMKAQLSLGADRKAATTAESSGIPAAATPMSIVLLQGHTEVAALLRGPCFFAFGILSSTSAGKPWGSTPHPLRLRGVLPTAIPPIYNLESRSACARSQRRITTWCLSLSCLTQPSNVCFLDLRCIRVPEGRRVCCNLVGCVRGYISCLRALSRFSRRTGTTTAGRRVFNWRIFRLCSTW
jgi:ankyrin repeat protein